MMRQKYIALGVVVLATAIPTVATAAKPPWAPGPPALTPPPGAGRPTTTTTSTTTTTTVPANPLNIRWAGYACDEYQSFNGWISMLAVIVRHDGPADAPGVDVTYETQDGSLTTAPLSTLNPGETSGYGWADWPRVSTDYSSIEYHTFRPTFYVRVSYVGQLILERTFTLDGVKAEEPACAPVIDSPGVPG